jgi:hypothetical protein
MLDIEETFIITNVILLPDNTTSIVEVKIR